MSSKNPTLPEDPEKKFWRIAKGFLALCLTFGASYIGYSWYNAHQAQEVPARTGKLRELLQRRYVKSIRYCPLTHYVHIDLTDEGARAETEAGGTPVKGYRIYYPAEFDKFYHEHFEKDPVYRGNIPSVDFEEPSLYEQIVKMFISNFPTLLLLLGFLFYAFGMFNTGREQVLILNRKRRRSITFKDVQGMEEIKEELLDIVNYFKNPKKYEAMGVVPPKGILLSGPPGTGKTFIAKALAGELNLAFLTTSGSSFDDMFVGTGVRRMTNLFEKARKLAPCIIFIDEIDALGRARASTNMQNHNEDTLNHFLHLLDGFIEREMVIVIGATNRPGILDDALLRPGRFDKVIHTLNPSLKEREEKFRAFLNTKKVDKNVSPEELAKLTTNASYAEIDGIVNSAALLAIRKGKDKIDMSDLREATDQKDAGIPRKSSILSKEEKERLAFHETGHALVGYCLEGYPSVTWISIIPRSNFALGVTKYHVPEQNIYTKSFFLNSISVALGGKVAEELFCGECSSGSQNDLEVVTHRATTMISILGMDENLGDLSYYDSQNPDRFRLMKPYSEKTGEKIDKAVKEVIENRKEQVRIILNHFRETMARAAQKLQEKEVLSLDDFAAIVGPREELVSKTKEITAHVKDPTIKKRILRIRKANSVERKDA